MNKVYNWVIISVIFVIMSLIGAVAFDKPWVTVLLMVFAVLAAYMALVRFEDREAELAL